MAVKDRLKSGDGTTEADASYDFVCTADENAANEQLPRQNLALRYVQKKVHVIERSKLNI
jgi:hypothetical protein